MVSVRTMASAAPLPLAAPVAALRKLRWWWMWRLSAGRPSPSAVPKLPVVVDASATTAPGMSMWPSCRGAAPPAPNAPRAEPAAAPTGPAADSQVSPPSVARVATMVTTSVVPLEVDGSASSTRTWRRWTSGQRPPPPAASAASTARSMPSAAAVAPARGCSTSPLPPCSPSTITTMGDRVPDSRCTDPLPSPSHAIIPLLPAPPKPTLGELRAAAPPLRPLAACSSC